MSETTTHSPEPAATVEIPHLAGVPEGLQLETLDDIVGYQKEIRAEFARQEETDDYVAFKEQRVDEILAENGFRLDESDPDSVKNYELAKDIYTELMAMNDAQWVGLSEGQDRTEREVVARQLSETFVDNTKAETSPDQSEKPKTPEDQADAANLEKAKLEVYNELNEVTKKYAEQVAERSKRMVESAKTSADIKANREELSDLIAGVSTGLMDELEADGTPWEEIVTQIDTFIAEQTDSVIAQMEEHRMAEYNKARPIMQGFYDKWASWGQEKGLVTKGKLKKAAIFAVPGAALGATLIPLAGVVGFGAVTGGLAVMGTRSVARRLAGAKLDGVADSNRVATEHTADIRERAAAVDQATHEDLLDIIDERTEAYRKRNLRRTAGGLAIALTVGLVTAKGADLIADNVDNWTFGKSGELLDHDEQPNDRNDNDSTPEDTGNNGNSEEGTGGNNGHELSRNDMFDGYQGTREFTTEGQKDFNEWISKRGGYEVKPGDSVWKLSEQYLEANGVSNPTTYEIDAVKDSVLKEFKAKGLVDSRGWLSVGDTIKISK